MPNGGVELGEQASNKQDRKESHPTGDKSILHNASQRMKTFAENLINSIRKPVNSLFRGIGEGSSI